MKARDIMTTDVVTIERDATVGDAMALLEEQSIRHLVVVDDARLVGMVSDRDLGEYRIPLRTAIANPTISQGLADTSITEAMRTEVVTIGPDAPLREAIEAMLQFGVGAVPVVEGKRLVGLVSYVDVLQAVVDRV